MAHPIFIIAAAALACLGQSPAPRSEPPASPPPAKSPAAPAAAPQPKTDDIPPFVAPVRLGIVTFNIRYGTADDKANAWPNRKDQVFEILNDDHVEVFGLQEALRSQLDDIHGACPKLAEIGVGRDDGKTKGEYSAILYRTDKWKPTKSGTFWLSKTPDVPGSKSWKTACTRICTWARFQNASDTNDGKQRIFWVFNTHLDHVSADARLNGAKLIARRIAERGDNMPFVLTGDFNSGENEPAAQYFTFGKVGDDRSPLGPLVDTFRIVHPEALDVKTYHGFDPTQFVGKKIDYILTPQGIEPIAAWIDRRFKQGPPIVCPSDHFPVGAIFDLPSPLPPLNQDPQGGTGASPANEKPDEHTKNSGH
jgi:endonuclease/exonuclease/phosphatase family metal-dependent hydrolase